MLIVVRRSKARSVCSLEFKPILSKRADCRSPADGGVRPRGGVAVEKDESRVSGAVRQQLSHGIEIAAKAVVSKSASGRLETSGGSSHRKRPVVGPAVALP